MKRSRFSEEQVIAILKEHEAGMATAELCRKHGISTATFYASHVFWVGGVDGMHRASLFLGGLIDFNSTSPRRRLKKVQGIFC